MRTLRLYHVRHFDPLRGRWIMARYVCEAPEIRCRYSGYQLVGAPEVGHVLDDRPAADAAHLARPALNAG